MRVKFTDGDKVPHTCTYCDLRHAMCCDDEDLSYKDSCKKFVLGRCFRCKVGRISGGEWVEGMCLDDTNDFGGCQNFQEI